MLFSHKVREFAVGAVGVASLVSSTVSPVIAQGYAGTGVNQATLEQLCKAGAMISSSGRVTSKHYIDTTLKGRYSAGNSTLQQYKNQVNWFRSNCPAY